MHIHTRTLYWRLLHLLGSLLITSNATHHLMKTINFSSVFAGYKSPSVIPFYPEHLRNSLIAPLGKLINASSWTGLALNQSVDLYRWWRTLIGLHFHKKKSLVVIFLGGSTTFGSMDLVKQYNDVHEDNSCGVRVDECENINEEKTNSFRDCPQCVYPAYFKTFLQYAYPKVEVTVLNLAYGGCDSRCSLVMNSDRIQRMPHIDIAFTSFKVNDWADAHSYSVVSAKYESLVHFVLSHASAPALIDISMLMTPQLYPPHAEVTKYYCVPVIDVEANADNAPPSVARTWDPAEYASEYWDGLDEWPIWKTGTAHPEWMYHRALAEFMAHVWMKQSELAVRNTSRWRDMKAYDVPPMMRRDRIGVEGSICWSARDHVSAVDGIDGWIENVGLWILGDDVPGRHKPGWWLDRRDGGRITFRMSVRRDAPIIGVLYLQSYDRMGRAEIWMDDNTDGSVIIDARDMSNRVSVAVYQALCSNSAPSLFPACGPKPLPPDRNNVDELFMTREIHIKLLPNASAVHNKFKLISLTSC